MSQGKVEDSLFSLEVYVDQLRIHSSVACAFPSVILKILDFEPVLITYYPAEFIEKLRQLSYENLRHRIIEFKTADDCYDVKSGKSVLFRFQPRTLALHFEKIPLYVLINDELPYPRKLLGVVPVSIHALTILVMRDMVKNGPLAPSCHEKSGIFKVQSLMGQTIGVVGLKLRLTMIGPNILGHIPETLLAKQVSQKPENEEKEVKEVIEVNENDKQEIGVAVQTGVSERSVANKSLQTDEEKVEEQIPVQNKEVKPESLPAEHRQVRQRDVKRTDAEKDHLRDILANLVAQKREELPHQVVELSVEHPNFDADASDCQDVRARDVENNQHLLAQPPPMFYNSDLAEPRDREWCKENAYVAPFVQGEPIIHPTEKEREATQREEDVPKTGNRATIVKPAEMPLLNALLNELTTWKSRESSLLASLDLTKPQQQAEKDGKSMSQKHRSRRKPRSSQHPTEGMKVKEDRKEFLKRLSSPRVPRQPHGGIVPKSIGWLRSTPQFRGAQDTQLKFGMTHTQKMRAALHRPQSTEDVTQEKPKSKKQQKQKSRERKPYPRPRVSVQSDSLDPAPTSYDQFVSENEAPRRRQITRDLRFDDDEEITSPEPAPRSDRRQNSLEEPLSQMERLNLRGTMETTSHAFTSVEEAELARLKESSDESDQVQPQDASDREEGSEGEEEEEEEKQPPEKKAVTLSADFGVPINPIRSNRSPLVSGRVSSNVPSMASNGSQSIESTVGIGLPSRHEVEASQDDGMDPRSTIDLNPDDTSEWRTSLESQYSPHKPPLPSRSFDSSPSPRQRRRRSDGSSPTTPSNRRSPRGPRVMRSPVPSQSYSSFSSNSEDLPRETPNFFDSSSVMSSGTKVTPMTRGSTTKGSIFIPPISSARTESVSSYMPTDPDNMSPMSDDESFSDIQ